MVKVLKKTVKFVIAPIILIFFISFSLLLSPKIQKIIVKEIELVMKENIDVDFFVKDISLSPLGFIEFKGILLKDYRKDTILYIDNINAFVYPHSILFKKMHFAYLDIENGFLRINKYEEDSLNNLELLLEDIKKGEDTINPDTEGIKLDFYSTLVNLSKFSFYYQSQNIKIDNIEVLLTNINSNKGNYKFNLEKIDLHKSGYEDIKTKGKISIKDEEIKIDNFQIKKGDTKIKMDIDIGLKKDKIDIKEIDVEGEINIKDFQEYRNNDSILNDEIMIVKVNRKENTHLLDIYFSDTKDINFKGDISLVGKKELIFNIKEFKGNYKKIERFISIIKPVELPYFLKNENLFLLKGKAKKTEDKISLDMVYEAKENGILNILMQGNLKSKNYNVDVKVLDFNLSNITGIKKLEKLNLDLKLESNKDTIKSIVNIKDITYNKFLYKNILLNIEKKNSNTRVNIISKEQNIDINSELLFFKEDKNKIISLSSRLNKIVLPLEKGEINVSMGINGNVKYFGDNIEDFKNINLYLSNIVYKKDDKAHDMKNLELIVKEKEGFKKNIIVRSDNIVNLDLNGNFMYKDLKEIFKSPLNQYVPYSNKNKLYDKGNISMKLFLDKVFLKLLDINISEDFKVEMGIDLVDDKFKLVTNNLDYIRFGKYNFENIKLSIESNINNRENFYFHSKNIKTPFLNLNKIEIKTIPNIIYNDKLFFEAIIENESNRYSYVYFNYKEDNITKDMVLGIEKSILNINENDIMFINENSRDIKITFNKNDNKIIIDSLIIGNDKRQISIVGEIQDGSGDINLDVKGINLDYKYDDTLFTVRGKLRTNIIVRLKKGEINPFGKMVLDDFELSGDDYGKVELSLDEKEKDLYLEIKKDDVINFYSKGKINFNDNINLHIEFNELDIKFLSTLKSSGLTNIRGLLSGKGNFIFRSKDDFFLTGNYKLKKAGLGVNYLGIDKDLADEEYFTMDERGFILKDMGLYENNKRVGEINGVITHDDFKVKSWYLDLDVKSFGAIVFNQKKINEEGLKGLLYADGLCNIKGYIEHGLSFDIKAKTVNNSFFSVILNEMNKNQYDIMSFKKDIHDEKETIQHEEKKSISKFNFELEIDNKTNIIIGLKTEKGTIVKMNDRISLYGKGRIGIKTITSGNLELYGRYDIEKGDCFLNIENMIEKKFEILDGSYITSDGDIKNGLINIKSRYKTKLNIYNYITSSDNSKRYETWLDLGITENISNPKFNFDIKMPYSSQEIQNELNYKLNEGNERENQFFSILSFGTFLSNQSDIINSNYIFGSFLSSQLSNIANRFSDNLDINFNYLRQSEASINQNQNNTLNSSDEQLEVGISRRIFSDRLYFSGSVGVPISENRSNSNTLSTDIQIEASITEDNSWKAKVFSKQEPSVIQQGDSNFSQGVGISYKTEFISFWEFFKNLFSFNKKQNQDNDKE